MVIIPTSKLPYQHAVAIIMLQWLKSKINSRRTRAPSPSPLLNLNADVLIIIISLLPPSDKMSAALACKSTFFIYSNILREHTGLVSRDDKADFSLRLERDLMATHSYCGICTKLHRFSSLNKPNENPGVLLFDEAPTCLSVSYQNSPLFSENHFAYHHGRAAMNRHLHGFPAGIDPDSLSYMTSFKSFDDHRSPVIWSGQHFVKIIGDSVFLLGKHAMDSTDAMSMMTRLDEGVYGICPHTTTEPERDRVPQSLVQRPAGLVASEVSKSLQEPGREVDGSCARCLTDYTVQITRTHRRLWAGSVYRVEIQTYTDLGQFRSPEEWKWRAWRREVGRWYSVEPRDLELYPPGSIRQRVHAVEDRQDE